MTFTIAEDIKTLLTNDFISQDTGLKNADFETGTTSEWTHSGLQISTIQKHSGCCSGFLSGSGEYMEQSITVPVDLVTAFSFWVLYGAADASDLTVTITYSDSTTTIKTITNIQAWTEYDYITDLTAGKTISKIRWEQGSASPVIHVDDITLTWSGSGSLENPPNIRLIDDDNPDSYKGDVGEIIIGEEQLLRIDFFNGIRTETFLVDMDVLKDDQSASAPTNLKIILAEIDRVFDAETFALTTYIYKSRYNWLGSYRIGVVKYQVEVSNALVTRPALV